MIEEVEKEPVLSRPDRVADRRRVGGDDQALARHRLEERPGEHEGIGVVDRQRPGEMDPRRIDAVLYLVQKELLPSRPFRRRQPVSTLPIGADEEDFRLRNLRQDVSTPSWMIAVRLRKATGRRPAWKGVGATIRSASPKAIAMVAFFACTRNFSSSEGALNSGSKPTSPPCAR